MYWGTHSLIETCKSYNKIKRFIHVSTDEVYGESEYSETKKTENSILEPTNPYAATKAAAEHIVKSYYRSFDFPVIITRGNNVYGKYQYPEKIIPKFIHQCLNNRNCTLHGNGKNLRTYIHVTDVVRAFETILSKGKIGEIYNIGSDNEYTNIQIAEKIIYHSIPSIGNELYDLDYKNFIEYIKDRDFNDKRYHIDSSNLKSLGWEEKVNFDEGLQTTIDWYKTDGFKNNYWDI